MASGQPGLSDPWAAPRRALSHLILLEGDSRAPDPGDGRQEAGRGERVTLGTVSPKRWTEAPRASQCGPELDPAKVWTQPGGSRSLGPFWPHQQRQRLQREGGDELLFGASQATQAHWSNSQTSPNKLQSERLPASADEEERHPEAEMGWWYPRYTGGVPQGQQQCILVTLAQLPCDTSPSSGCGRAKEAVAQGLRGLPAKFLIPARTQWTGQRWPMCPQAKPVPLSAGEPSLTPRITKPPPGALHSGLSQLHPVFTGGETEAPDW